MVEFQGCSELILIGLLSTIVVGAILLRRKKHRGPPTPPSIPIIGHLHLLHPLTHRAFHNLSTRYGPIFQIFLGSLPCVIVSTPEAAKQFLKTHESSFCDRLSNAAIHHITYGSKSFIFSPHGPYWKFMRKVCVTQLLGGRTLELLSPLRRSETIKLVRRVLAKAEEGQAVDVNDEVAKLTNSIISRMIMGRISSGNDREAREIRRLVSEMLEITGEFNLSEYVWFLKRFHLARFEKRLKQNHERIDNLIEEVINEHQEERRRKRKHLVGEKNSRQRDLLDILLDIHEDEEEGSEIKLTRDNVKAFVMDLFVAGTDTSAITMEWALSELINNPHVMEKARQEIESVVGKNKIIEESDIVNLPYLQAIVKETLRIHPPAPFVGRLSNKSCKVNEYEIPTKTNIFINVWSIGRDPNIWEEPLEFKPERFMSGAKANLDVRGQHFELLPFGSGRRVCPGASLALNEVQTNLGAMIQCFDWKVDGDKQSVDMEEKAGSTCPRAHPLICFPHPRLHPFPSLVDVTD